MPPPPPDPLYTIRGNMSSIHCLCYVKNVDREVLYAGTSEGYVHIWELMSYRELNKIKVSSDTCLSIFNDEGYFVTQEKGGGVKFWVEENDTNWKLFKTVDLEYFGFCKLAVHRGLVICPEYNSVIKLYSLKNDAFEELKHPPEVGQLMCLKYLRSFNYVLAVYEVGLMTLWEVEKFSIVSETRLALDSDCPMGMDYSESSRQGVLGTSGHKIFKFSVRDRSVEIECETVITNSGVSSVSIHPEGKLCAVGCWDGYIRYFSMKKLKLLAVLDHHTGTVECVLFSEDKLDSTGCITMSAGGKDGKISFWTLYCQNKPIS